MHQLLALGLIAVFADRLSRRDTDAFALADYLLGRNGDAERGANSTGRHFGLCIRNFR